jgi:hypothetical protein
VAKRACNFVKTDGERCRAPPLHDSENCFVHAPEHAGEMAEARRLGGLRRKREGTLAGAFDIEGLADVSGLRRVLDITLADLLGLDNSIPRARALIALVGAGSKLLEVGEHEERLEALEAAVKPREPPKIGRRR